MKHILTLLRSPSHWLLHLGAGRGTGSEWKGFWCAILSRLQSPASLGSQPLPSHTFVLSAGKPFFPFLFLWLAFLDTSFSNERDGEEGCRSQRNSDLLSICSAPDIRLGTFICWSCGMESLRWHPPLCTHPVILSSAGTTTVPHT